MIRFLADVILGAFIFLGLLIEGGRWMWTRIKKESIS